MVATLKADPKQELERILSEMDGAPEEHALAAIHENTDTIRAILAVHDMVPKEASENSNLKELCKNQRYFPDQGYTGPIRTRTKCPNPAFADHKLHRIGFFKDKFIDQGIPGWSYLKKCVNCGLGFDSVCFVGGAS